MKSLMKVISTILFYGFVLVLFMWTATLTLAEVRQVLPGDPITPYFALALFDGGALVWLLVFTIKAKGLPQRGVSLLLLIADLAGVVSISLARLLTGGQELTEVSPEMGAAVVYGVGIMTALNFLGSYAYHITDPDTLAEIEAQSLEDELYQEAQSQARANMQSEKTQLAGILAARATAGIKSRLYLPVSEAETLAMSGVVLEGEIIEETAKPKAKKSGVPAWMMKAAQKITKRKVSQSVPQPVEVEAVKAEPTEAQKQAARDFAADHSYIPGDGRSPLDATMPTEADRLTPTEQASAWANIPPELEERMAKYGDRHDKANAVFFDHDETPRYHPSFGLEGKRWETIDGERVMIGGLHKAFQEGVAIAEASPDTGESFQDIHESQDGGLDGGYIPTQEAV